MLQKVHVRKVVGNLYEFVGSKGASDVVDDVVAAGELFQQGVLAYSDGDSDAALEFYRAAAKRDPKDPIVWMSIGGIHAERKEFSDAVTSYEVAIEIDPSLALAHFDCGLLLNALGFAERAIRHFCEAIQIDKQYADAHCNLASVYTKQCQYRLAIQHYQCYLRYRNNSSDVAMAAQDIRKEIRRLQRIVRNLQFVPLSSVPLTPVSEIRISS